MFGTKPVMTSAHWFWLIVNIKLLFDNTITNAFSAATKAPNIVVLLQNCSLLLQYHLRLDEPLMLTAQSKLGNING